MHIGSAVLNLKLAYVKLAWPIHPKGQPRKLVSNSLTSLFVYGNLSIKQTWVTLCVSHKLKVWD